MSAKPKISIITPVGLGRDRWLNDCCTSVSPLVTSGIATHIIVGDGIELPEIDGATVLNMVKNRGVCAARNAALCAAKTDMVFMLDAELVCEGLLQLVSHMRPTDGWAAGLHGFGDGTTHRRQTREGHVRRYRAGKLTGVWNHPDAWHPNNLLIRTDLLAGIGGWPGMGGCEDRAVLLCASIFAPGMALSTVTVRWCRHDGQTTREPTYGAERKIWIDTATRLVNATAAEHGGEALQTSA